MNTSAIILMASAMILVSAVTGYFFYKVLTTPRIPDSKMDDIEDDENRTFRYDAT
ncbi:MAG: hypothetical protein JNK66_08890 [Chitinophagales bacterium]|nr:hypothetical protein [Chitinophagales bacterium]